jgi:hypothetical protein
MNIFLSSELCGSGFFFRIGFRLGKIENTHQSQPQPIMLGPSHSPFVKISKNVKRAPLDTEAEQDAEIEVEVEGQTSFTAKKAPKRRSEGLRSQIQMIPTSSISLSVSPSSSSSSSSSYSSVKTSSRAKYSYKQQEEVVVDPHHISMAVYTNKESGSDNDNEEVKQTNLAHMQESFDTERKEDRTDTALQKSTLPKGNNERNKERKTGQQRRQKTNHDNKRQEQSNATRIPTPKTTEQRFQEEVQHPEFLTLTTEETLFSFLYGALCMLFSVLTYKFSLEYVWLYWLYPFTYFWSGVAGNMFVHIVLYNWAPRELVVALLQIHDFHTEETASLSLKQKCQLSFFGLFFAGMSIGNMYLTESVDAVHWMYPLTFFYSGVAGNVLIALFFVPMFSKKVVRIVAKVHDIH